MTTARCIQDLTRGASSSDNLNNFISTGDWAIFQGGSTAPYAWISNGTAEGTQLVNNTAGFNNIEIRTATAQGDYIYFLADNQTNEKKMETKPQKQ